ncbi:MAG TPA: hypothetical protein VIV11_30550 [Kofleriaceae bacterium]
MAARVVVVDQLATLLARTGHRVAARAVVANRTRDLAAQLKVWIDDPQIELVIGINSSAMRAALLPLITKRLVGFTDLRRVDGGQCQSTIVILVPKRDFAAEMTDQILPRLTRALRPGRQPTQPPPPPRSESSLLRLDGTGRARPKTTPPPLPPPADEPDFVHTHTRHPEKEFADQIATISPIRLEPLPLVVSPITKPPPDRSRRRRIAIGVAAIAGALFGVVIGAVRSDSEADPRNEPTRPHASVTGSATALAGTAPTEHEPATQPTEPIGSPESVESVESVEPTESTQSTEPTVPTKPTEPTDVADLSTIPFANVEPIEMPPIEAQSAARVWSTMAAESRCNAVSCERVSFLHPCCAVYRPQTTMPPGVEIEGIAGVTEAVRRCQAVHAGNGVVTLAIDVGSDGYVKAAVVRQAPTVALGKCVAKVARQARFAHSGTGAFSYSFRI